ncbi:serine/threonine-protein kinase TIO isoform X2 [Beta vulgaris subsp. vulgaris]|uniref:serine/threonine-protein kinase TIO isoform X2 n=1 Tax=Beta vulgaris subsp. vulgaris TaxID=3555 RepID=UPI00203702D9|nr:serine/threonine-protein kinase TIO isoform X2 [Beta vulgaris subsp. vulgaris]
MGVENYHVVELVGEGSFGRVYKGRRKYTGQIVAMKFIMKNGKSEKDLHGLRQEIEILKKLKHENIIEMLDSFETAEEFCVVTEFAQGELFEILENDNSMPEVQVQAIAKQLVCALHYLHSNRIIHRDMKPQNILICSGSKLKLCDFGFARAMSTRTVVLHSVKGTPLYMAPELVRERPYNHTVDLWSLGVILYELFVGQPPFYTNSVYSLIRHIVKDPVKYPENISSEFRTFLEGLLNKVPEQRLSWPALLKHPFIREDLEESLPDTKNLMECQAALKGKTPIKPVHLDALNIDSGQPLDRLENGSCKIKEAKIIGQEMHALELVLEPVKIISKGTQNSCKKEALRNLNQSLRILSNLVAAEAIVHGFLDKITFELLELISAILSQKSPEVYDLIAKALLIIRKLISGSGLDFGNSYFTKWVAVVELYSQIIRGSEDSSGRILYESNSLVAAMLNQAVLAVKKFPLSGSNIPLKILVHAKTSSLVDHLCQSLAAIGTSKLCTDNLLCAASEGCIALWYLVDALENLSIKNKSWTFPLTTLHSHLLGQVNIRGCDTLPDIETDPEKVVVTITRAFLNSEPVQVAMLYCLRQRIEKVLIATIQLLLRCCMQSGIIPSVLCGIPRSLPVATVISGGGDDTFVSEIFSMISLCGSYMNTGLPMGVINPCEVAMHSCLLLATIAQTFYSTGRKSAVLILTSSLEKQKSRLLSLACLYSVKDGAITSLQPHLASAMLAFASILLIDSRASAVFDIAMPFVPCISALCDFLKMEFKDGLENNCTATNYMFSCGHGLRDGCVGLLICKLRSEELLALKKFGATGLPQSLFGLLRKDPVRSGATDCLQELVGLSPVGVVWAVSCLSHCLSSGVITFQQMMLEKGHVKSINHLISSAHLNILRNWGGPGGRRNGVREIIDAVIDFLAFPFVVAENVLCSPLTASMNGGFLLNVSSPAAHVHWENEDFTKAVKKSFGKYMEILIELEVPIQVLHCADIVGLEDIRKPVAFLAKMVSCKAIAICLVRKGMLEAARMRRLLDDSSPKEVILDMLMIVSDLARKDVAGHGIISLLIDRCTDSDKRTRKFACFAVGNAAFHNDSLYEELRRSISPLTKLLHSTEDDVTKSNAAGALSNLVRYSDKLCDDIIRTGAIKELLKVVNECSTTALNSPKMDVINASPLNNALCALAKMCACHSPCSDCIRMSDTFQLIVLLQQLPEPNVAKYARSICTTVMQSKTVI